MRFHSLEAMTSHNWQVIEHLFDGWLTEWNADESVPIPEGFGVIRSGLSSWSQANRVKEEIYRLRDKAEAWEEEREEETDLQTIRDLLEGNLDNDKEDY